MSRITQKFITLAGPVEKEAIFNRAVWHEGDILHANMINAICREKGASPAAAAGYAIQHVLYDQNGLPAPPALKQPSALEK